MSLENCIYDIQMFTKHHLYVNVILFLTYLFYAFLCLIALILLITMGSLNGAFVLDANDMAGHEPVPPSSPVHAGMTMDEARALYMDMVLHEREAMFRQA